MESTEIDKLKILIESTCHKLQSVEQFCEESGLAYQHVRKPFRRAEGLPLSEYYQRCRQKKAEAKLADLGKRIFEIAAEMGFKDESNFTNWFKHRTGLAPRVYRNKLAEQAATERGRKRDKRK